MPVRMPKALCKVAERGRSAIARATGQCRAAGVELRGHVDQRAEFLVAAGEFARAVEAAEEVQRIRATRNTRREERPTELLGVIFLEVGGER
jgi:hypothetical protein